MLKLKKNGKSKPLFFNVRSKEVIDYLFRANDKLLKADWVQALRQIKNNKRSASAPTSQVGSPAQQPPHELKKSQSEVLNKNHPEQKKKRLSFMKKKET